MKTLCTIACALVLGCSTDDPLELEAEDDGPIAPEELDEPSTDPEIVTAQAQGCSFIPKVIIYAPGFNTLPAEIAAKMESVGAVCAQYYFMLPAVVEPITCIDTDGDGTEDCLKLRARTTAAVLRAKSPSGNFHAMAEFHWHHWAAWIARSPGTRNWTMAGRQFRRDMADAGFDVAAGDTWSINELHSGLRRDLPDSRDKVVDAVTALDAGDPDYVSPSTGLRAARRRGVVFAIGQSQHVTNLGLYKSNLKDWLRDAPFWNAMKAHVQYFAQEVYPDPANVCRAGSTLASRAKAVNAFSMHFARLAESAAGTSDAAVTAAARTYFDKAYVPLLGGVWPDALYGNTLHLSATQMMHFVSLQIYATRLWATQHAFPDARVGLAWRVDGTPEDKARVTERAASAIMHAYADQGSRAAHACSPSGAGTWCQCAVAGASFNPAWASFFATW